MNEHEIDEKIKKLETSIKIFRGRTHTLLFTSIFLSLILMFLSVFVFGSFVALGGNAEIFYVFDGLFLCYALILSAIGIYWILIDWWREKRQTQQFCNTCGKKIEADAMFCKYCGKQQRS